jgi:Fe-S cluster assembly iron-binding protein IscA
MVQITEAASNVLLSSLTEASTGVETGYRLAESGAGYKLQLDHPVEEDRVVREQGHVVFMVEPRIDDVLEGVVLDLEQDDKGERLTLRML